jgi:hypothetical protein
VNAEYSPTLLDDIQDPTERKTLEECIGQIPAYYRQRVVSLVSAKTAHLPVAYQRHAVLTIVGRINLTEYQEAALERSVTLAKRCLTPKDAKTLLLYFDHVRPETIPEHLCYVVGLLSRLPVTYWEATYWKHISLKERVFEIVQLVYHYSPFITREESQAPGEVVALTSVVREFVDDSLALEASYPLLRICRDGCSVPLIVAEVAQIDLEVRKAVVNSVVRFIEAPYTGQNILETLGRKRRELNPVFHDL